MKLSKLVLIGFIVTSASHLKAGELDYHEEKEIIRCFSQCEKEPTPWGSDMFKTDCYRKCLILHKHLLDMKLMKEKEKDAATKLNIKPVESK